MVYIQTNYCLRTFVKGFFAHIYISDVLDSFLNILFIYEGLSLLCQDPRTFNSQATYQVQNVMYMRTTPQIPLGLRFHWKRQFLRGACFYEYTVTFLME